MKNFHIYNKNGTYFIASYPSLYELFRDMNEPYTTNNIQILTESEEKEPLYIWEELAGIGGRWIVKEKVGNKIDLDKLDKEIDKLLENETAYSILEFINNKLT